MKCPNCASSNCTDSVRLELCHDCGYEFYYGDAHAKGEARESKLRNPGDPMKTVNRGPPENDTYPDW